MKRNEFFAVAKITRAPIKVCQHADMGFFLKFESDSLFDDEIVKDEYIYNYNDEPRFFKSLSVIEKTLRQKGIFSFSVELLPVNLSVKTRTKKIPNENLEVLEVKEITPKRTRTKKIV